MNLLKALKYKIYIFAHKCWKIVDIKENVTNYQLYIEERWAPHKKKSFKGDFE